MSVEDSRMWRAGAAVSTEVTHRSTKNMALRVTKAVVSGSCNISKLQKSERKCLPPIDSIAKENPSKI